MFQSILDQFRDFGRLLGRMGVAMSRGFKWWFEGARQVGSQMREGLGLLGQGLLKLLLLPYTLFLALVRALKALSGTGKAVERSVSAAEKNLRGSVIDLEENLKAQPGKLKGSGRRFLSFLRRWFSSRPTWQQHTLRAFAVLCLLAVLSAYPAWRGFKAWRVDQLLEQASAFISDGRVVEAYYKGRAAYNLDPGNPDVLAELIELSRVVRSPDTLTFGRQLLERGAISGGTMALLAEEAQDRRQLALARAYLRRLELLDPDHPDLTRLRIQFFLLSRNEGEALRLAREASQDPAVDRRVFLYYVQLGLGSEDALVREDLQEELVLRAEESTERGLFACVFLLDPALATTEAPPPALVPRILSHPEAGREERLAARRAQLTFELKSFEEIAHEVRSEFDLNESAGRLAYATWLFRNQLYAEVTAAFERASILDSRSLATLHTLAQILSGREQEALTFLRGAEAVILPEVERLILEARALRALDQNAAFASTVERAIARADAPQFAELERLLRQLGEERFMAAFYEHFAEIPQTAALSNANLLVLAYRNGDEARLNAVTARSRLDGFGNLPVAQGLLTYLEGLSDEQVTANIRAAERLVAEYPSVMDFRVALAVNYFRAGFRPEAAAILDDTGMVALSRMSGMYAVSIAILKATGNLPEGLPAPAPTRELLPREEAFIAVVERSET